MGKHMFRLVVLLALALSGCHMTHDIEDIDQLNALLDGGLTIHIEGIPEGGVPVRLLSVPPTVNTDGDAGE